MNTSPLLLSAAAPVVLAFCLLAASAPRAAAQRSGGVIPVANPAAPSPAETPAAFAGAPTNVENPPPAAKPDPNAPVETEILATSGADFASQERIAVFRGDVRVNDPRFQLACDKLTVFLAKTAAPDGAGKDARPAAGNTPPPANGGGSASAKGAHDQNNPGGGIDHAVADGHVIIIQKRPPAKPGEEAKISIGRATEADFDNKTGDMVLRGWPSVEQNGNTQVALAQSTVMTLHKDNSMNTVGPSRTIITEKPKETPGSSPGASPGPDGKPGGKTRPHGNGVSRG